VVSALPRSVSEEIPIVDAKKRTASDGKTRPERKHRSLWKPFAMVASTSDGGELIGYLEKDRDSSYEQARSLDSQVQSREDQPRRQTIPANVSADLELPDRVYENISGHHEKKAESEEHPER